VSKHFLPCARTSKDTAITRLHMRSDPRSAITYALEPSRDTDHITYFNHVFRALSSLVFRLAPTPSTLYVKGRAHLPISQTGHPRCSRRISVLCTGPVFVKTDK